MIKPELSDFGLNEGLVFSLEERIRKTSNILEYTIPVTFGAFAGLMLYIIYYQPFTDPDYFRIGISFFAFGGFGVLFMGVPMVFFHVFNKFYIKQLKNNSDEYNSLIRFRKEMNRYEQWNLRNEKEFWKNLDKKGLIYEISALLEKKGYSVLKTNQPEYIEFDLVLNKDFITYPVFIIRTRKKMGISELRKIFIKLNVKNYCAVSVSGFTKQGVKYAYEKGIFLIDINKLIEINYK